MDIQEELARLRRLHAQQAQACEPLQEIRAVRQDDSGLHRVWFRSGERELLAGELDGRWIWLEYSFPLEGQLRVLRWSAPQAPALWCRATDALHAAAHPGSELLQPLHGIVPTQEVERWPQLAGNLPASLRQRVTECLAQLIDSAMPRSV